MTITNHMRYVETFYPFKVFEKDYLLLQTGAGAELLRTLGLENQVIVNRVSARFSTGFINASYGFRFRRVLVDVLKNLL